MLRFRSMSHDSLWHEIVRVVGIPSLALTVIILIKVATAAKKVSGEDAVDWGMDIAVLATGACGAIFANRTLFDKWGDSMVDYGIGTVIVSIIFVGILAVRRRWFNNPPVGNKSVALNVILGLIPLGLVTAILILGYTLTPEGN